MLDPQSCLVRQRRLLEIMQQHKLNAVIVGSTPHVYYFTGYYPFWLHEAAFVLHADGRTQLACGREPMTPPAVDEVSVYESNWLGSQRQEQAALAVEKIGRLNATYMVGLDTSAVASQIVSRFSSTRSIDESLWQLRRQKDGDELNLMKQAIACSKAMYDRARKIVEPGISELRVYAELHAAAIAVADEPLTPAYLGNDYACNAPGGPPRASHLANSGELYILDLGPAYRGYFCDNCRTFSVDRNPTDAQMKAWEVVIGVFPIIERLAKPGIRCRDIYAAVDEHYREKTGKPFPHHVGHGVGLQPHEFPHLNPNWDDVLMEREVFTVEPGMYSPELRAGMRIENNYVVTATGVENLTPFPIGLT